MISLKDKIPGAPHFTWHEALWLPSYNFHAFPPEDVYKNIILMGQKIEEIRQYFNRIIFVTSWYRPPYYNQKIGGAAQSLHMRGMAVDFEMHELHADIVRGQLYSKLDRFDICMEDMPGTSWVHIDIGEPRENTGRYFKP